MPKGHKNRNNPVAASDERLRKKTKPAPRNRAIETHPSTRTWTIESAIFRLEIKIKKLFFLSTKRLIYELQDRARPLSRLQSGEAKLRATLFFLLVVRPHS